MIKIDHATFTYGENNEYSVGIRDIALEIEDGQGIMSEVGHMYRNGAMWGERLWKNNTHSNDQWVDSTLL